MKPDFAQQACDHVWAQMTNNSTYYALLYRCDACGQLRRRHTPLPTGRTND